MATTTSRIPLTSRAEGTRARVRTAIIDEDGRHSYDDLLRASAHVAGWLLDGRGDLDGARVPYLIPPSLAHVAVQWGICRAGGVAVPLCTMHPRGRPGQRPGGQPPAAARERAANARPRPRARPAARASGWRS